jgi:hypothetical protein
MVADNANTVTGNAPGPTGMQQSGVEYMMLGGGIKIGALQSTGHTAERIAVASVPCTGNSIPNGVLQTIGAPTTNIASMESRYFGQLYSQVSLDQLPNHETLTTFDILESQRVYKFQPTGSESLRYQLTADDAPKTWVSSDAVTHGDYDIVDFAGTAIDTRMMGSNIGPTRNDGWNAIVLQITNSTANELTSIMIDVVYHLQVVPAYSQNLGQGLVAPPTPSITDSGLTIGDARRIYESLSSYVGPFLDRISPAIRGSRSLTRTLSRLMIENGQF